MYHATFTLESITPIFMRGADQGKAEIRASSIKGLMRWWFRALAGSYFGDDVEGLREAENFVFGSTERKSHVSVELGILNENPLDINMTFDSWSKAVVWSDYADYFWAFAVDKRTKKGPNKKIVALLRTPAYDSGTRLLVKLSGYDEWAFRLAECSLWALAYLGGIGFRNRKFGGSLSVVDCSGDYLLQFIPGHGFIKYMSTCMSTILDLVKDSLEHIKVKIGAKWKVYEVEDYPKYPAFVRGFSTIFVGSGYHNWIHAIDSVGHWYLGVRRGKKFVGGFRFKPSIANRKFSHKFAKLNKKTKLYAENEKRPYLGLPINYFNYKTIVSGNTTRTQRRASGLIFTVNKGADEYYYPTITTLCYQFLPCYSGILLYSKKDKKTNIENGELVLQTGGKADNDFTILSVYEEIVRDLQNKFARVEVFK